MLHSYGPERYLRHAVASVVTLRRHDAERPVALFCTERHRALLGRHGLTEIFSYIGELPEEHRSIVGFKHHLHRFMPFERVLFVDADMVWCRDPDPLWQQLSSFPFTATGLDSADFWFGGPKSARVLLDVLMNRRRRTLRRFGLTYLPRVQAGMIYARDEALTHEVGQTAGRFLKRQDETHFRSRLRENGRSEESCEWSLAMAMSHHELHVFPWLQGHNTPQFDFIEALTDYDLDFRNVTCQYYCDPFVYSMRGLQPEWLRQGLMAIFSSLPGRGDYMEITPYALHFGWVHQKQPFHDFAARIWERLLQRRQQLTAATARASLPAE